MQRKRNKGFTLVELLIVIAIIGVIAAVAVPLLLSTQNNAISADLNNTITRVELAMEQYKTSGSKTAIGFNQLISEDDGLFISEQQLFLENAGKGVLPGGQLQTTDIVDVEAEFNDVVYNLIRKEAITAVKAFADVPVIDTADEPENNYFLNVDVPEDSAIVYNYLTGKVFLEKISTMQAKKVHKDDGSIDIDAFYVYLTKPVGNGEGDDKIDAGGGEIDPVIPEDDEDFIGDFYLRVTDWVTKAPISDVYVDLYNGIEHREYKTDSNGYLILDKVFRYGEYVLTLEKAGYVTYFDEIIYANQHENAEIVVTKDGYLGDGALNVYGVELINVTQGDLSFTKTTQKFDKVSEKWVSTVVPFKSGIVTVTFEPDVTDLSPANSERAETYRVDLSKTDGKVALLDTVDGIVKKLTFGNYIMTVDLETEPKIRTLVKKVTVDEYGIDERIESERQHIGEFEFYTYVQELRTLATELSGNISSNMELTYQPLTTDAVKDTDGNAVTYWNFKTAETKSISTQVELWKNGVKCYTGLIDDKGNYDIVGIEDGIYDVYLNNTYCEKFQPSNIGYQLKAEGYDSTLDMTVAEADYPDCDVTFKLSFPDGSSIDTSYSTYKTNTVTNVKTTNGDLVNGQAVFKLKAGIYTFSYVKPYAKTEDNFKTYVLVTDKGVVIDAKYTQVNTKVNIKVNYPSATENMPNDTVPKVILTNIDKGNVATPITLNMSLNGVATALVKPGHYKVEIEFAKHYNKIVIDNVEFFSKAYSWLDQYIANVTKTATYNTDLSKHTNLVYESTGINTHNQHCLLCDYKSPSVICTFNGTKEVPTDSSVNTHHYTYCSVCKLNKELQVHKFEGTYKAVGTITKSGTGTHYRKCLDCPIYGLNGVKDTTESCTLSTTIQSTTHTFKCTKCANTKAITHNYNGAYKIAVQATKSVNGMHQRKCFDCESYGTGSIKDKSTNCTMATTGATTSSTHYRQCSVCLINKFNGAHEWGNYLIVTPKSATNVGQHNRQCGICGYYEATANCNSVEDTANVTTTMHRYKCTTCGNYYNSNHNFNGAYKVTKAGAGGMHNQKCAGCSVYGIGSGTTSKKDGTTACTFGTPVSLGATQHKATCTVCNLNTRTDNHTWGSYVKVTDKTTATDGKHKRVCTGCTQEEITNCDSVLSTTESTDTQHVYKCSKCGNTFKEDHTWVTTATTATTVTKKCSVCAKVITVDNHPPTTPVIEPFPKTDNNAIKKGRAMTLTASSTDEDGDEITYEWKGRLAETSTAYTVGTHTVKCRAKDSNGAYSDWASYTFTVKDEAAVILSITKNIPSVFDIHGTVSSTNTDLKTTFADCGYKSTLRVNGTETVMALSGTCDGVSYTRNVIYDDVMNYVKVVYTVTNTTTVSKTIGIACDSDIMIGSNDRAGIYPTSTGFKMTDGKYDFYVNIQNMTGVTNADSLWYGNFSNRSSNRWTGTIMRSSIPTGNMDTGFAMSWMNRTLAVGESKTFSFIINIE